MTNYRRPHGSDWVAGVLVGALLGVVLLGVGGRIGMRVIALELGQTPTLTVAGSVAVVLLGAAAGGVVGAIFLASRALFPHQRLARVTFFWLVVGALVLRGLHPLSGLTAEVFVPLFLLHGGLLFGYWCRIRMRQSGYAMRP